MRYLGLDIGNRRTGVAFYDDEIGIVLPLSTIEAKDDRELVAAITEVIADRAAEKIAIGLPRLPSGDEGEQAAAVRRVGQLLSPLLPIEYIDERFTSQSGARERKIMGSKADSDAYAACQILQILIDRK